MSDSTTQASPPSVYLCVSGAADAIAFYTRAFGAQETFRLNTPDGSRVVHANMDLNGGQIMLSDDFPEWNGGQSRHPLALGATPVTIHLQVPDVDAAFARAVEAGCTVTMPLEDQFWGDRYGRLRDPFGHEWSLATTKSTPSREEMEDAMKRFFSNCS